MTFIEAQELMEGLPVSAKENFMRFVIVPLNCIDYNRYMNFLAMSGGGTDETAKIFSFDKQFSVARVGEKERRFYHQAIDVQACKFTHDDILL